MEYLTKSCGSSHIYEYEEDEIECLYNEKLIWWCPDCKVFHPDYASTLADLEDALRKYYKP